MKSKNEQKPIYKGSIGWVSFDLFVDYDDTAASSTLGEIEGQPCKIIVGLNGSWDQVFDNLVHEAIEASFILIGGRLTIDNPFMMATCYTRFYLSHEQYQQAISQATAFINAALKPLLAVYTKRAKK